MLERNASTRLMTYKLNPPTPDSTQDLVKTYYRWIVKERTDVDPNVALTAAVEMVKANRLDGLAAAIDKITNYGSLQVLLKTDSNEPIEIRSETNINQEGDLQVALKTKYTGDLQVELKTVDGFPLPVQGEINIVDET